MASESVSVAGEAVQLPALIDRATRCLTEARSSAEVLEARAAAQAALHYAKVTKAANETQADCLRMIVRAEMRMADEIDASQARGEVETVGGDRRSIIVQSSDNGPPSIDQLGVDRRRVAEWREVRDAGEQAVEQTIQTALSAGRAPTKSEILEAARQIRSEQAEERRRARIETLVEISKGNSPLATERKYPVIYADPPWRYEHPPMGGNRVIENHYPTMNLEEICALPVRDLATEDAVLFLWATAPKLGECFQVVEAWGFDYRTCAVWIKDKIGMGYYVRNQHELLLIAKRGEPPMPAESARAPSVIHAPRTEHSAKPVAFHELIERMYPELPKIELFCRSPRDGWAVWGNQAK